MCEVYKVYKLVGHCRLCQAFCRQLQFCGHRALMAEFDKLFGEVFCHLQKLTLFRFQKPVAKDQSLKFGSYFWQVGSTLFFDMTTEVIF